MSIGQLSRSTSRSSHRSRSSRGDSGPLPPAPSITPFTDGNDFEPCAATGSFFLYAQRNVILCLHHDTLAVERRFDNHREDVVWIAVDNISERGAGRHVVSYDVGQTAIVWDLFTGEEIARFAAYEQIRVAAWMRNGNIAFGNVQGNVILFEPSTSEHISARTIFDPITALAPAGDCRTFAIGAPSQITGLAWHASSSKQKSEMLATQTLDGDLRVWSVPKPPHSEAPNIIRVLSRSESRLPGPCWFAWSKMGRLIQYAEGETRAWDVRTKRVSYEIVPTIEGINAIANYGPTATLFTLGRNHTVQQYDLNPASTPILVADVQHVPANAPPSPPNSADEQKNQQRTPATAVNTAVPALPIHLDAESEEEATTISPLQKIAEEMDQLEEERRDRVGPLSPSSSSRTSVSSRGSSGARKTNHRRHERTISSRASEASTAESSTVFSYGSSLRSGHESISIRSTSSAASYKSSGLRNQILRSPEDVQPPGQVDLFPFTKARLSEVPFRPPQYGDSPKTTDFLRQQMLKVVFGWEDDIEDLIRDELARHPPNSASSVILSKWLGDLNPDTMAAMVGSESMAASDWMLLALSSMGQDSQKKVGEAFVQRLLQKGDIHAAVAIVVGLGELNEAVEIYVSQKHFMEAVLLTCLIFPADWQRQSHLVRKWGEVAVAQGQPELAVRCFSCTSIDTSDMWFSPRAQDAVFHAQKEQVLGPAMLSPQLSPPITGQSRIAAMNSSLKLVTHFDEKAGAGHGDDETPMQTVGVTPIVDSALSPGGASAYLRPSARDPSSARTATPGGFGRRRLPSRDAPRASNIPEAASVTNTTKLTFPNSPADPISNGGRSEPASANPITAKEHARKSSLSVQSANSGPLPTLSPSVYEPPTAVKARPSRSGSLPSPAPGVFQRLREQSSSRSRGASRDRKPDNLHLEVVKTILTEDAPSTAMPSSIPTTSGLSTASGANSDYASPQLTGNSLASTKARSIDKYISSLEEANYHAKRQRAESRQRGARSASRSGRRDQLDERSQSGAKYIKPAKRSPSSPVPMSPDESYLKGQEMKQDEDFYRITSPIESVGRGRSRSNIRREARQRSDSKTSRRQESPDRAPQARAGSRLARSRAASRPQSPEGRSVKDGRGRSKLRGDGSVTRSPSSPRPMSPESKFDNAPSVHARQRSTSRRPGDRAPSARRQPSLERGHLRDASTNRKLRQRDGSTTREVSPERGAGRQASRSRMPKLQTNFEEQKAAIRRKELAAKELEERRLSLARRPSAPVIPHPGELSGLRPSVGNRSATEMGNSPNSYFPSMSALTEREVQRSNSVDPDSLNRYSHIKVSGTSTNTAPIGLPATPRAMRYPKYMGADPNEREDIPAVPEIPASFTPQNEQPPNDDLAPLLPSSVFGQKPADPPRSASAPIEGKSPASANTQGLPTHPAFRPTINSHTRRGSHARKLSQGEILTSTTYKQPSPPIVTASIDETLHDNQIVIIEDPEDVAPPVLEELRHLATPPPPPPPPSIYHAHQHSASVNSLGVINIGIEDQPRHASPVAAHPSEVAKARSNTAELPSRGPTPSSSPNMHRRGRNSVSDNIGSRIRGVADRMRSTSRSRNKSPPIESFTPSPYETVLPPIPFGRNPGENRTKSPLETIADSIDNKQAHTARQMMPPPPPPAPSANGTFAGYRHPREVRANMPPDAIQAGVTMTESGMI
ncbi:MAG: hypothetical protein M1820_001230 [Bogoriella megaspora]|nr:MAG: hypothetical protein M1820_001230 [Bogoriella megaspora]